MHQFAAGQESDAEKERAAAARRHVQREPFAEDETQGDKLPVLRKAENTRQYSEVFRNLAQHPKLIYVPKDGKPAEKTFPVVAGLGGKTELMLVAQT